MDIKQVASLWVELQHQEPAAECPEELEQVEHDLYRACLHDPQLAWSVVMAIFDSTEDEWVLANLAAGPIETLLAHHNDIVFDWIKAKAKSNNRFRSLLDGVWRNLISDEVWEQMRQLPRK